MDEPTIFPAADQVKRDIRRLVALLRRFWAHHQQQQQQLLEGGNNQGGAAGQQQQQQHAEEELTLTLKSSLRGMAIYFIKNHNRKKYLLGGVASMYCDVDSLSDQLKTEYELVAYSLVADASSAVANNHSQAFSDCFGMVRDEDFEKGGTTPDSSIAIEENPNDVPLEIPRSIGGLPAPAAPDGLDQQAARGAGESLGLNLDDEDDGAENGGDTENMQGGD